MKEELIKTLLEACKEFYKDDKNKKKFEAWRKEYEHNDTTRGIKKE